MTLLKTANIILLPGTDNEDVSLSLSRRSDNSAVFGVRESFCFFVKFYFDFQNGVGSSAYFTWNGPTLSGQVMSGGTSWSLEGCGEDCFNWVKQERSTWQEETCEEAPKTDDITVNHKKSNYLKVKY